MRDPFTDQTTQPAGEGQGANRPQQGDRDDAEDQGLALEEGFSPVP